MGIKRVVTGYNLNLQMSKTGEERGVKEGNGQKIR
jgi:hypothetical protein